MLLVARMMTAAKEALVPFGNDAPLLIAVTVLTSMEASDLQGLVLAQPLPNTQNVWRA
jgi:orotidine-5'-phosphate decarboxylase